MKCPCCGAAELIHDTRDMPTIYKEESTIIPSVTGDFCPACGEVILNRVRGDRYSELIGQFHRNLRRWCQCLLPLREWEDQAALVSGEAAEGA